MNQRLKGGIVFLFLGLLIFGGGAYSMYPQFYDVNNAEPVDAEIVSSEVDTNRPPGESDRKHYIEIKYTFQYEGESHASWQVYPGGRSNQTSWSNANSLQSEYSAGDSVTAHVVDGDPEQAFLVKSSPPLTHYLIPGVGAVMMLLGALNVVQGIRGVGPLAGDD